MFVSVLSAIVFLAGCRSSPRGSKSQNPLIRRIQGLNPFAWEGVTRVHITLLSASVFLSGCPQVPEPRMPPLPPPSNKVGDEPQAPVYGQESWTLFVGDTFAPLPTIGGGSGTGNYQFSIAYYSNWPGTDGIHEGGQGTLLPPDNVLSDTWVPVEAGVYSYWVRRAGDDTYADSDPAPPDEVGYTINVIKRDMPDYGSTDAAVLVGQPFTPEVFNGIGSGADQFTIANYTNWPGTYGEESFPGQPGTLEGPPGGPWTLLPAWTPTEGGTYEFYVRKLGDDATNDSPIVGPYTLTVNKQTQPNFGSSPQTIPFGQPFSPVYEGVVGTGASQFTIENYTNWPGTYGEGSFPGQPGTLLGPPEGPWELSDSWTATETGTYRFYVRNLGDASTEPAGPAGPYDLTITGTAQEPVSIDPARATVLAGIPTEFTALGGSGTIDYQWGGSAEGSTGNPVTLTFETAGEFSVTVFNPANGGYEQSNTATSNVLVIADITTDTDGDDVTDAVEVVMGTDPLIPNPPDDGGVNQLQIERPIQDRR